MDPFPVFWVLTGLMPLASQSTLHAIHSSELDTLVNEFPNVFSDTLGKYNGTLVSFSLDSSVPLRQFKPRRVPFTLCPKVDAELDNLIQQGILEPVDHARWETPTVIAMKANDSIHICTDYQVTLNHALQAHAYRILVVQHLLHSLGCRSIFAKLDLSQTYQQLPVDDMTAEVQTIVMHCRAFQCHRLQFRIPIAPGIFQSLMERLLHQALKYSPYYHTPLIMMTF